MPRYYGPGQSRTENEALRNVCKPEKPEQKPQRRVQVWQAPEEEKESLKRFLEQMEEKHDS
jgi:hypothetical protein